MFLDSRVSPSPFSRHAGHAIVAAQPTRKKRFLQPPYVVVAPPPRRSEVSVKSGGALSANASPFRLSVFSTSTDRSLPGWWGAVGQRSAVRREAKFQRKVMAEAQRK